VFSAAGELVRTFGLQGINTGELQCPYGVTVDNTGRVSEKSRRVFVVDWGNDCMVVLSTTGKVVLFFGGRGSWRAT
jgi:hypothetical protein